jgi:hypothetical protein
MEWWKGKIKGRERVEGEIWVYVCDLKMVAEWVKLIGGQF